MKQLVFIALVYCRNCIATKRSFILWIRSLIHLFIHHLFIHPSIHSFSYSLIRSFFLSTWVLTLWSIKRNILYNFVESAQAIPKSTKLSEPLFQVM